MGLQFRGAFRGADSSTTNTFRQNQFSERIFCFTLFQVIRHLKRVLPSGPQRKREVDYVLDRISETMTPMHYHSREVIFSTFNLVSQVKAAVLSEAPCTYLVIQFPHLYMLAMSFIFRFQLSSNLSMGLLFSSADWVTTLY